MLASRLARIAGEFVGDAGEFLEQLLLLFEGTVEGLLCRSVGGRGWPRHPRRRGWWTEDEAGRSIRGAGNRGFLRLLLRSEALLAISEARGRGEGWDGVLEVLSGLSCGGCGGCLAAWRRGAGGAREPVAGDPPRWACAPGRSGRGPASSRPIVRDASRRIRDSSPPHPTSPRPAEVRASRRRALADSAEDWSWRRRRFSGRSSSSGEARGGRGSIHATAARVRRSRARCGTTSRTPRLAISRAPGG